MTKFQFLFIGTSLSFLPLTVNAQCVATQDCATLGYTETSCNGGKGVKCPFGNKWACLATEESVCADNGFKYSCTGTGYAGGAGSACGGKYTQCTCANSYEWKNGSCQIFDGAVGDLYYCNGKVVGVKSGNMSFYVALKDLGQMGWNKANNSCQNYLFCGNFKGTLPTKDQLKAIYKNKSSLNSLFSMEGGMKLMDEWYWSSTPSNGYYYGVDMSKGYEIDTGYDRSYVYVRPVLVNY